ncbi:MAG: COX15/CtaA family protein [Alphaproteobacteria bacterium]|nr:COX15/CtaA family protein [Alphaproteobacteria bacterium]
MTHTEALSLPAERQADRTIAVWLLAMCALVYAMVVLGGVTRLTQSGLSMVEWRPLLGWLPPMSEEAWQAVFEKYQQFPEYQNKNLGMTLAGFKGIFWLEYLHRLLGRLIGLAFLLPFLWFWLRGQIRRGLWLKLLLAFVLGGLQGLMGWYMVKSGLVDRPDVSQYRLTAHLGLAVLIYAYLFWLALDLIGRPEAGAPAGMRRAVFAVTGLVTLTFLSGGFVAGLDAGFIYNSFPLMDGGLVPAGYWDMGRASPFEDIETVQFNHRWLAKLTLAAVLALWIWGRRFAPSPRARLALDLLLWIGLAQFALGVATLLSVVAIPLAALHQAGALALFTAALWLCFETRRAAPA